MALYKLQHHEIALVVRAQCVTCARSIAAENAREEGPRAWRDPSRSTIKQMHGAVGHAYDGEYTLLTREEGVTA